MANIFSDNFNRSDSSSLGGDWNEDGGDLQVKSNKLSNVSISINTVIATAVGGTPSSADYSVSADVQHKTNTNPISSVGLIGRMTSTAVFYHGRINYNGLATALQLYVFNSGATLLGSYAGDRSLDTEYNIKLQMEGSTIKFFQAGVERISVTNSALTSIGEAGVRAFVDGDTGTDGLTWDNFSIDTVGGTAHEEEYVETVTLVDTVSKLPNRVLTEAVALVDVLAKSPSRILSDTLTLADTVIKTGSRAFSEAVSLVDSVASSLLRSATLEDTVSLEDTIQKSQSRTLTDAVSLVDSVLRTTSRTLSDAVTLVDTNLKRAARTLSEEISLNDTVTSAKVAVKELLESLSLADTIDRTITKVYSESVTLVDTVNKTTARIFTDALELVDNVAKMPAKVFAEAVTLVDSFARITEVFYELTLSEIINVTDSISKRIAKTFTEEISINDTLTRSIKWFRRIGASWYNKAGGWYTKLTNSWKQTLEE